MKWVLITAIVLGVLISGFLMWQKLTPVPSRGFWDAVRNPGMMPDLGGMQEDGEQLAEMIKDSPEDIAGLVDFFVFEGKGDALGPYVERMAIMALGEKCYPRALELLADPAAHARLVKADSKEDFPSYPFERLCNVMDFDAAPPKEVGPLLASFLDGDTEIRKTASLMLGSVGTEEALSLLKDPLVDEDESVRSYAHMGIEMAILGERLEPEAKGDLFDVLASTWGRSPFDDDKIPGILLKLDAERGKDRLLQPDVFHLGFYGTRSTLKAFVQTETSIPRDKLLDLLNAIEQRTTDEVRDSLQGAALSLLGLLRDPADLPYLEKKLESDDEAVVEGAVRGIYLFHNFYERIRDEYAVPWEERRPVEKQVHSVSLLDSEVNNGGFAQYFLNSSGNDWKDAQAGLAAMGAEERLSILNQALAFFPDASPSVEHRQRQGELAKIAEKARPFEELDSSWYGSTENLDRAIQRYNLANIDQRLP